jgi:glycosyltransferase involved in cell wall biosynthesis
MTLAFIPCKKMKITIITATYNSAKTIAHSVTSLNEQTYPDIEHIIIDGNSKDDTLKIINEMPNRINTIISEPDKGIYDAMNKGISHATGEVIGILNSDDFYAYPEAIADIVQVFEKENVDVVFGNINYVSTLIPDRIIRKWNSGKYYKGSFRKGWHPAHPAFFVKKEVYDKFGVFNLSFKLAADFELMLRFLEKEGVSNYFIQKPIIHMRLGGATSGSLRNILKQNIECYRAFKVNNLPVSFLYPIFRLIPKVRQFFR